MPSWLLDLVNQENTTDEVQHFPLPQLSDLPGFTTPTVQPVDTNFVDYFQQFDPNIWLPADLHDSGEALAPGLLL